MRKGAGLFHVPPRQARRVGQHGKHLVAQNPMRCGRQKRRIHAAGVGHHQPPQLLQPGLKCRQLRGRALHRNCFGLARLCARRHGSDYTVRLTPPPAICALSIEAICADRRAHRLIAKDALARRLPTRPRRDH